MTLRLHALKIFTGYTALANKRGYMATSSWSYDNQDEWKNVPGCQANGVHQSPINITKADVQNDAGLKSIQLNSHWYNGLSGTLANSGTSLRFDVSDSDAKLTAETSLGLYNLIQFHFHWGPCAGQGSEHTINGVSQDAELHFVLRNNDTTKNDLTVLGVLLKGLATQSITDVWKPLSMPPKFKQSLAVQNYPVSHLFPKSFNYWHYTGSLTTPPCSEVVNWYVFHEHVSMPVQVLEAWRKMEQDDNGVPLPSNYRSVQLLNDRNVFNFIQ